MRTKKKVLAVKRRPTVVLKAQRHSIRRLKISKKTFVTAANSVSDPLEMIAASWRRLRNPPTLLEVSSCRLAQLLPSDRAWCFALLEQNVRQAYERSGWGWSREVKKAELFDPEASRYLLVRSGKQPAAFVHFRFDLEQQWAVLYCYEIHVDAVSLDHFSYETKFWKNRSYSRVELSNRFVPS